MKTKPFLAWLIVAIIALAVWFTWPFDRHALPDKLSRSETGTSSTSVILTAPSAPTGGAPSSVLAAALRTPGTVPNPGTNPATGAAASPLDTAAPGVPDQAAQINAGRVRRMIGDYHTLTGENPVGTNAEIMQLMTGGNARQAILGPPEGIALNAQGELVDQWGSPYFFHQLSRDKMEIRSAGPDKVMWTADDVIAR